jgi:hypothetical protein
MVYWGMPPRISFSRSYGDLNPNPRKTELDKASEVISEFATQPPTDGY